LEVGAKFVSPPLANIDSIFDPDKVKNNKPKTRHRIKYEIRT